MEPIAVIAGAVVPLLLLWASFSALKRRRLLEDLPTSKTTGVFMGLVEIKGTAESESPFTGLLSGKLSVHHSWKIEEEWSRDTEETFTDAKGNTKTKASTKTGWKTIASGNESAPFYLKDDVGVVRIDPSRAEIHPVSTFHYKCSRSDPLYFGKGPSTSIADSTGTRKFSEMAIPLHQSLYIVGQARERNDCVAAEIAYDPVAPIFIISTSTEESLCCYGLWMFWLLGFLAVLLPIIIGIIAEQNNIEVENTLKISLSASGAVLAFWLVGWLWIVYNSIIQLKNRVKLGAANIDVELKRRHDLIPRLVSAVGGLQKHERDIQETTALLRSQAAVESISGTDSSGSPMNPSPSSVQGCASRLIALVECYPDLQTDGAFMKLQKSLIETEQRIALARNYYNDMIETYNNRRERFPESLIAALARLQPLPLFVAESFERESVEVNLIQ